MRGSPGFSQGRGRGLSGRSFPSPPRSAGMSCAAYSSAQHAFTDWPYTNWILSRVLAATKGRTTFQSAQKRVGGLQNHMYLTRSTYRFCRMSKHASSVLASAF